MGQTITTSENILAQLLNNIDRFSKKNSIEESIEVLEEHNRLMTLYQSLPEGKLEGATPIELQELLTKSKELMVCLNYEKTVLIEKIGQMNESEKIATQYIKQFSESYFIDKDF